MLKSFEGKSNDLRSTRRVIVGVPPARDLKLSIRAFEDGETTKSKEVEGTSLKIEESRTLGGSVDRRQDTSKAASIPRILLKRGGRPTGGKQKQIASAKEILEDDPRDSK